MTRQNLQRFFRTEKHCEFPKGFFIDAQGHQAWDEVDSEEDILGEHAPLTSRPGI